MRKLDRITQEIDSNSNSSKIKIVLLGDGNSGKTSMIMSYTTDRFNPDYLPTVFECNEATIKRG